jgi:hypothetical protein
MGKNWIMYSFLCMFAILFVSIALLGENVKTADAQAKSRSITLYSIFFAGLDRDGKPVVKITNATLSGVDTEIRAKIPSVAEAMYAQASESTIGPSVTLGHTLNETTIKLSQATKDDLTKFIESVLSKPSNGGQDSECWMWWVGGGSMHGSCPHENVAPQ